MEYSGDLTHSNFHSVVVAQSQETMHFLRSGIMTHRGRPKSHPLI